MPIEFVRVDGSVRIREPAGGAGGGSTSMVERLATPDDFNMYPGEYQVMVSEEARREAAEKHPPEPKREAELSAEIVTKAREDQPPVAEEQPAPPIDERAHDRQENVDRRVRTPDTPVSSGALGVPEGPSDAQVQRPGQAATPSTPTADKKK